MEIIIVTTEFHDTELMLLPPKNHMIEYIHEATYDIIYYDTEDFSCAEHNELFYIETVREPPLGDDTSRIHVTETDLITFLQQYRQYTCYECRSTHGTTKRYGVLNKNKQYIDTLSSLFYPLKYSRNHINFHFPSLVSILPVSSEQSYTINYNDMFIVTIRKLISGPYGKKFYKFYFSDYDYNIHYSEIEKWLKCIRYNNSSGDSTMIRSAQKRIKYYPEYMLSKLLD